MSGPIKKIVEKAGKVESLWALWNLVKETFGSPISWLFGFLFASWGGLMTWLGKQTTLLGEIGWPEAVLFGIGATAALALAVCACLALYRYFRPLAAPEIAVPASPVTEGHLQAVHNQLDYQKDILDRLADDLERVQRAVFSGGTAVAAGSANRVEQLEKSTEHLRERMNSAAGHIEKLVNSSPDVNMDLINLLSFAVDQATVALLDRLIAEAPTAPIPLGGDKDQRDDRYGEALRYVRKLYGQFPAHIRGASILNIAAAAESEAETLVQKIIASENIQPAQVIELRRFKIVEVQCQRLKNYLERERAEVAERALSKRDALIERMDKRNPK